MVKIYDEFEIIMDKINKKYGRSFDSITKLHEEKILDNIIEIKNLHLLLKQELEDFIEILYDPYLDMCPLTRKIHLYRNDIPILFSRFGYEIGTYFGKKDSNHMFHEFIKAGIKKLNININKININELENRLNYFLDTITGINPNRGKEEQNISIKSCMNKEKYKKYKDVNKTNINYNNEDMFFIWSEKDTYEKEKQELEKYKEFPLKPKWVAKKDGDGFGFDILSYDYLNQKEKAIEVKSGMKKEFSLTENEYNTIKKFKQNGYCNHVDYYVYKYTYDFSTMKETIDIYKYDYENETLYNIETNETVTFIEEKNKNNETIYTSIIEKQKTLKKTP